MSGAWRMAARRRVPWWVLALLFVVLPVVEIYVLIRIGQTIGAWWTVLLLIGDGVLGSWLMKHQGSRAWAALTTALRSGRMPAKELADAGLILVGGTLLLTPGFVSDIFGLFLVLPFTRRAQAAGPAPGRARPGQDKAPDPMVWSGARSSTDVDPPEARRPQALLAFFLEARCRWAGPISPPRSSSSRSLRISSSSVIERRSRSMSQWVRTGFSTFTSRVRPSLLSASAPQRGHSQTAGTSASTDIGISNSWPCGHP
jgi:UPF0716 family protein affecting phage T7 exclusion